MGRSPIARPRVSLAAACVTALAALPGCLAYVGGPVPPAPAPDPNDEWEEAAEELEGDKVYDADDTWMGEMQALSHVPNAQVLSGKISVTVPHPMERDHYITAIYIRDDRDVVVGFTELDRPDEDESSLGVTANFDVLAVESVRAYAHCNQHDTWRSAELTLEP